VEGLILDKRVDFIMPANYSDNSTLDKVTKDIIRQMASVEKLKAHTKTQLAAIKK
jgi:hypothetical protein